MLLLTKGAGRLSGAGRGAGRLLKNGDCCGEEKQRVGLLPADANATAQNVRDASRKRLQTTSSDRATGSLPHTPFHPLNPHPGCVNCPRRVNTNDANGDETVTILSLFSNMMSFKRP